MANRLIDNWMWAHAHELLREAERHSRQFFQVGYRSTRAVWQPPVDVFEQNGNVVVQVVLPGVTPEQVRVELQGTHLIISGVRRLTVEPANATIRLLEIPYGRFERILELKSAGYRIAEQSIAHGCLRLSLCDG